MSPPARSNSHDIGFLQVAATCNGVGYYVTAPLKKRGYDGNGWARRTEIWRGTPNSLKRENSYEITGQQTAKASWRYLYYN